MQRDCIKPVSSCGWWEAVYDLAADPLSSAIIWSPHHDIDVALMESIMSYNVGSLGVIRSVLMY